MTGGLALCLPDAFARTRVQGRGCRYHRYPTTREWIALPSQRTRRKVELLAKFLRLAELKARNFPEKKKGGEKRVAKISGAELNFEVASDLAAGDQREIGAESGPVDETARRRSGKRRKKETWKEPRMKREARRRAKRGLARSFPHQLGAFFTIRAFLMTTARLFTSRRADYRRASASCIRTWLTFSGMWLGPSPSLRPPPPLPHTLHIATIPLSFTRVAGVGTTCVHLRLQRTTHPRRTSL